MIKTTIIYKSKDIEVSFDYEHHNEDKLCDVEENISIESVIYEGKDILKSIGFYAMQHMIELSWSHYYDLGA